ncbi:MAG: TGS domain-containing protein, partial [Clostridiales bacterium]
LKNELEDLSLRYLEPEKYRILVEKISMKRAEREEYIKELSANLAEKLAAVNIEADISGRPKNFYSIYNKMQKQQKDISEIYDINAMRIVVNTVKDCYGALGVVHTLWKPIPGRFKDYIAMPKSNMYQSIHTTVIGPNGAPFEVQIRTWEMHRVSEYGIAAHWRYKEDQEGKTNDPDFDRKVAHLRKMLEFQMDTKDAGEFMDSVRVDLFEDSVFVFSPRGDVYELPRGSTPVDFAYRVHTQVGHECVGAKIGNRIVTLDYQLRNGDIVEILTAKGTGPSRDWLKITTTPHAKNKIRQWFRREGRDENLIQKGRELLEKEGRRQNMDMAAFLKSARLEEIAKRTGYFSDDDFLVAIAEGAQTAAGVLAKIKEEPALRREFFCAVAENPFSTPETKAFDEKQ